MLKKTELIKNCLWSLKFLTLDQKLLRILKTLTWIALLNVLNYLRIQI